jgi:hypothetical protein
VAALGSVDPEQTNALTVNFDGVAVDDGGDAGHVYSWHETDMPKYLGDVRYWVNSGKHLLALSFSGFDPQGH